MKIELINPHVLKILISLRKEDSISSISKRIKLSYGWTNKWVNELIKEEILSGKWRGVILNENNKSYQKIISFIKSFKDVNFYYSILELFGIDYCFTKTDAVYLWTEGRYNIARYKEYYPIFIKVKKQDYSIFLEYCKKLGLNINSGRGIFYFVEISDDFKSVKKQGFNVEPLEETLQFMQENTYNFEPALEMIKEMYNKKINVKYKEVSYL